jgi:tRNA(fMet)-specific endonuclease VapC
MEAPCLGIILNSSVVVDAERQHLNVAQFLKEVALRLGDIEIALCCITVAELAHGIHRADNSDRRKRRRAFLDGLKAAVPVYPIGDGTAELVGKIGAECATTGVSIPFDDLLIAACAMELGYAVATRNLRHFQMIPGLTVLSL